MTNLLGIWGHLQKVYVVWYNPLITVIGWLSVLYIVTATPRGHPAPSPSPCMHVSLLYQARSLEDHLQVQEAANHQHRYRMDVLNQEHIMSYKEQGVGAGILEYFPVLKVLLILELPALRALLCRSVCREMRELSTDNVFITFDMHLQVLATLLKTLIANTIPDCDRCTAQCTRTHQFHFHLVRSPTMHNQDNGFALHVQRFCCTHSLSTAMYTWDDRQVWHMD